MGEASVTRLAMSTFLLPLRAPCSLHMCTSESRIESPSSKLKKNPHPVKIEVTVKTPIGVILVVFIFIFGFVSFFIVQKLLCSTLSSLNHSEQR